METLEQYEELKALYIKYIGINEKLKKVVNKKPKAFIKYIKKHYKIIPVYMVEVIEPCSVFQVVKKDKQQATALLEKFKNCNVLKSSITEIITIIKK